MRAKIYYNLMESPYIYEYENYIFVFSSEYYRGMFAQKFEKQIAEISASLSHRFKINIYFPVLAAFVAYRQTEKRGYLVKTKGGEVFSNPHKIMISGERCEHYGENPLEK